MSEETSIDQEIKELKENLEGQIQCTQSEYNDEFLKKDV